MEVIFHGLNRNYYSYEEELYTATFPVAWAETHEPKTGPKECNNCRTYGSWNGVFIGYCSDCAEYIYEGGRGCGFKSYGEENIKTNKTKDWIRAYDTYLYGINLDDIGDTDFCDSRLLVEYYGKKEYYDEVEDDSEEKKINENIEDIEEMDEEEDDWDDFDYGFYEDRTGTYGSSCDGGYNSY
jgi:hypothetical protein